MAVILTIEDDPRFARLAAKVLRAAGHTVLHAGTALDGLRLAEQPEVEIVLLDMDLPDLDGKVAAASLRTRLTGRGVPIVAVTARDDGVARRLALGFGCDGFIAKPIDTRAFPHQVVSYLVEGK
ncbi:MAG: response regulator [Chloroflexi bacterium]|nr:response regulator [Chloroflexota bacterium]